ncbi:DUF6119 family protein [Paracidovorax avenae]|uniref:DUF6119 family protein n=1 Tax=Paracidovorax avenae TaxID=80867 RepID=UPI000AFDB8FF|nr:DUF6119 family protein [Paracidovorax avenae]
MIKDKSISLSLRLVKDGFKIDDALRGNSSLNKVSLDNIELYVSQSPPNQPEWVKFIEKFAGKSLGGLFGQSCGAVLFLEIPQTASLQSRLMAVSFGSGHHSLDPKAIERNFGLRVALNSISTADLRSLDVASMDTTTFQRRIQSSRSAEFKGFGVNVERDLLRLAAGVASDQTFAKSLAGRDSLLINAKINPDDLVKKCSEALAVYQSKKYQKDYAWVDYIIPETDKVEINSLDTEAFAALQDALSGRPSDMHLAVPEIINPEQAFEVSYFGAGLRQGKKRRYVGVDIGDYVAEIAAGRPSEIVDMDAVKGSHEIKFLDQGGGSITRRLRIYDCFSFELIKNGSVYVLFGGEWFKIQRNFYDDVERSFCAVLSASSFHPATDKKNERELILDLDGRMDYLNLDQVKLAPSGAPGANIEPCDFLCRSKRFIHLKDGHSSGPLSHLWNQGLVSAESFVRDPKFRRDLRDEVKSRQLKYRKSGFEMVLPDGRTRVDPGKYKVIFGVIRSRNQRTKILTIPFFSKVSLRPVVDRILLMGFKVEVHLIEKI